MKEKLIGALVGIARATDGSEHLITAAVTAFLRKALAADFADEAALVGLVKEAEEVKRGMVPNCFLCANPCGRTSDYNMADMGKEPEALRKTKESILARLMQDPSLSEGALYRGLFAVGLDGYTGEEVLDIFNP